MKTTTLLRSAMAGAVFLALSAGGQAEVSTRASAAPSGTYAMDPAHFRITARISHFGFSHYVLWLKDANASISWNANEPEKSSLAVSMDAGSAFTGNPKFDDELDGPDWFDAAAHPEASFVSRTITRTSETTGTVEGDLTFRGVTQPVTLEVTFNGTAMHPLANTPAMGFSARAAIKRSQFGMTKYVDFGIGDEVEVLIEAEFLKEPD